MPCKGIKIKNMKVCLLILSIFIHNSLQQAVISRSNTVVASCTYQYDLQNRYSCHMTGAIVENPADTLVIVGTHLSGHTDADVTALSHDLFASFTRFNGEALRKFINLRYLDLRRITIVSMAENAFEVCGQLEEIEFGTTSRLRGLPSRLFNNCRNLKTFRDHWGFFESLPDDLFGDSRSLEVFHATSGRIDPFPVNLFQYQTNLRIFVMSGMGLTLFSSAILRNARNLEEINIEFNRIEDAQEVMNVLSGLLTLQRIHIAHNSFPMFSLSFFTRFPRLSGLSVSGGDPSAPISWQSLPSTLTHLSYEEIPENIPAEAFSRLSNLIFLRLTGLGIRTLHPDTFVGLTNLQSLALIQTCITALDSGVFRDLINLRHLGLTFHQFRVLPNGIFAPLSNLTTLYMFHNKLQRLSMSNFGQHPNLIEIGCSNNEINAIQRGIFGLFSPIMSHVSFNHNDCVHFSASNVSNLDENEAFERCFNHFDGIPTMRPPFPIPTTTPSGCKINFMSIELILMVFVKILFDFFE